MRVTNNTGLSPSNEKANAAPFKSVRYYSFFWHTVLFSKEGGLERNYWVVLNSKSYLRGFVCFRLKPLLMQQDKLAHDLESFSRFPILSKLTHGLSALFKTFSFSPKVYQSSAASHEPKTLKWFRVCSGHCSGP